MPKIPVAVIEDSDLVRELTIRVIGMSDEFEVSHIYSRAEDAAAFMHQRPPRIALMDIHMPGMSGIDCVERLRDLCPDTLFMMFTVSEDDGDIFEALRAGAQGYLLKGQSPDILLTALRDLHDGGSPMSASIARRVVSAFHQPALPRQAQDMEQLTDREHELLNLLAGGLSNKEIADRLYVSYDTVKKHINNIYRKLQVRSRAEALHKVFNK